MVICPHAGHDVLLRGAGVVPGATGRPLILQRTDAEFLPAILEELKTERGRIALTASAARTRERQHLKLYQPIHRVFHVALFEAVCDAVGEPRRDPQTIESSGMVIRRVIWPPRETDSRQAAKTRWWDPLRRRPEPAPALTRWPVEPGRLERWVRSGAAVRGWMAFHAAAEADEDPDPARRRPAATSGHPEIDRRLAAWQPFEPPAETVAPLFLAPPEVCRAAGRTILFGLVPTASSELSEAPDPSTYPIEFVQDHLVHFLRASDRPRAVPRAGQGVTADAADEADLEPWLALASQALIELDAFGESAAGQAFRAQLDRIRLPYRDGSTRAAGGELRKAADVLVHRDASASVEMPLYWPAIPEALAGDLAHAAKAALDARLAALLPRTGRFDDPEALYALRGFVRVRRPGGCPPRVVWSDYSEPFRIAPWHDSGVLPPLQVSLPDVTRESVRKLKPNVAFTVPGSLFNMLDGNKPEDLLAGKGQSKSGLDLAWICGFNIPVITLCAFIVLSIFLKLMNIIFWWLPFIKICIPFPRKK